MYAVVVQVQEKEAIAIPMLVSAAAIALGAFPMFARRINGRTKAGESYASGPRESAQ